MPWSCASTDRARGAAVGRRIYNTAVKLDHTAARVADLEERAAAAEFDPAHTRRTGGSRWARSTGQPLHRGGRAGTGTTGCGRSCTRVAAGRSPSTTSVAQQLNERWWISLPHKDLAYLVEGTEEFWAYISQMRGRSTSRCSTVRR